MDFLLTEKLLRNSLVGLLGSQEIQVSFARFYGTVLSDMPREGVTYYPALAIFHVPAGQRLITRDQYQLEPGITALVYPVYRARRASILRRVLDDAIPACRVWFQSISPRVRKPRSFCVYYDQTFDEVVYRPNPVQRIARPSL